MSEKIPHYIGKGPFGLASDLLKNIATFTVEKEEELGDFYSVRLIIPLFVSFRPEIIQHVLQTNAKNYRKSRAYDQLKLALGNGLVTSEGAFWRRQRRMAQPAFYKARLEELFAEMADVIDPYILDLKNRVGDSTQMNASKEMMKVTADIVMRTLFSAKNESDEDQMYQMMSDIQEYVVHRINHPLQIPFQYINGNHRRFKKYRKTFSASVFELIEQRRATQDRPADLLSMLLEARDADTAEGMSDEELRDEAITIFSAGHETSANAMAWTLYLLANHPEVVEKLRVEERKVLDGKVPSFQDLIQLKYHQQVLEEVMRLYPPAHSVGRQAIEDDEIDGIKIPKKSVVVISIYALHRSPKYWKDPEKFDPDRFSPERVKARRSRVYLPFGAGARMCIGNHFAMMEMQLLLARLIRYFDFKQISDEPIELQALITLKPKNEIQLICSQNAQL